MTSVPQNWTTFRDNAEALRRTLDEPLDPPTNRGEMFIADSISDAFGGEPVFKLDTNELQYVQGIVRGSIREAQASTERELAEAVAASGRGYSVGEMNVELDVVRAGQQWLARNGTETEQRTYQAIWQGGSINVGDLDQITLLSDEVAWLDTAYTSTGHEPPVASGTQWPSVLEAGEAAADVLGHARLVAELDAYDPETDPEVIAARQQDPSLNVDAHEADREAFERDYERHQRVQQEEAPQEGDSTELLASEEDAEEEWTVTPEQMLGKWVETVATVRTLVLHGDYAGVRKMVREADTYLDDVGLDVEADGLYLDVVTRAAIPTGNPPTESLLDLTRRLGAKVPDLPSPVEAAAITGVSALPVTGVERALRHAGRMPMPRTAEAVEFTKAFRAETGHNATVLLASYNVPGAPGQALVERLDGSPHSYVSAMRTGAYSVVLNDVLGNQIEPEEVPERLGIEPAEAQRVIRGLENGLEAAEKELHPEEPQTGGVKQMSTAELDRIPVADSPEDVTNPSSANPLDSGWHPQPSDAAAGGPGW
ncbi:MAG: hypothetical protein ACTIMA_13365 [Brachybacterium tyrofermentans]|uniref:hypothetical protein n=3 Tax=Dermabacteraceae TaxID=85020 RepID=UPI0011C03DEF|nr:hypothetical protein [Brachybacterium alimentarium]